jgi:hypothetical protein
VRLLGIIFLVVGLCIITAGVVWLNVISPRMDWLPPDYKREDTFRGTFRAFGEGGRASGDIPVVMRRMRQSVGAEGGMMFIAETVTASSLGGEMIPELAAVEEEVGIFRDSRRFLPEIPERAEVRDRDRVGYLLFPPDVKREIEYAIWVPRLGVALPASFDRAFAMQELEVFRFITDMRDVTLLTDTRSNLPTVADVYIEYMVEPRSGLTVDEDSDVTNYVLDPQKGKTASFATTLSLTEDNVTRNIERGKIDRFKLRVMGSFLPWLVMGLGMLFGSYAILLFAVWRWQRKSVR